MLKCLISASSNNIFWKQTHVTRVGAGMESSAKKRRRENAKEFEGFLSSSSAAFMHAGLESNALFSPPMKIKTTGCSTSLHTPPSFSRDGYAWRKYGQKPLVNTTFSRAYYRCALHKATQCMCKRTVDWDRETGELVRQKYTDEHNHPVPEGVREKDQIRDYVVNVRASAIHHEDSELDTPLSAPRSRSRFFASAFSSVSDATDVGSLRSPSAGNAEFNPRGAGKCHNPASKLHAQWLYLEHSEGRSEDHDSAVLRDDLEDSSGAQSHLNLFPQDDGDLFSLINAMSPSTQTRRPSNDAQQPLASTSHVHDLCIKDFDVSLLLAGVGSKSPFYPGVAPHSSSFDSHNKVINDRPVEMFTLNSWEDTQAFEQMCSPPVDGDDTCSWLADLMGTGDFGDALDGDFGNALDACGIFESAGDEQIWATM